jgi:uncharacterized protein (TIGR02611 family)
VKRQLRRGLIGFIGGIVVVVGIIMIPYPGPGWLVVFAGLSILATEFAWAQRVLDFAKSKYDAWVAWVSRQNLFMKALIWLFTTVVVVVTIWLLNGYGVIADILNIDWHWLQSPFVH